MQKKALTSKPKQKSETVVYIQKMVFTVEIKKVCILENGSFLQWKTKSEKKRVHAKGGSFVRTRQII